MDKSNLGAMRYLILRKELTWGDYDAGGTDLHIPFWGDGFNVRPKNTHTSQEHTTGTRGDTHRALTGRDFTGDFVLGLWPEHVKTILDWMTVIDANGNLASFSATVVDPNVETMQYFGLRVNSGQLRVGEGEPTLLATLSLIARWGSRMTAGIPALPSYPADISYILQDGTLLLDAGGAGYVDQAQFLSFDLSVENNLTPGRHGRSCEAAKNKTITSLRTGTQRVSGSLEVEHTGPIITDAVLAASEGTIELLFFHPTGQILTVDAAGAVAGAAVVVPVTTDPTVGPAYDVGIEEHAFMETGCEAGSDDPDNRSVGKVTALGAVPNTVTIETLDRDLSGGDKIYGHAFRVRVSGLDVDAGDPSGGREDQRNQTYEFNASEDGSAVQFEYAVQTS